MGCGASQIPVDTRGIQGGNSKPQTHKHGVKVDELLRGHLSIECPSTARIVRIFTSSTFTDTRHERNALMERVYPALKEVCQLQGYEFQVVDMRWGIRDEATDDHMATELCLREVDLCKKLSTGPFFVTFLSHKYGYRSFPRQIEASEFESLMEGADSSDVGLLQRWFKKDDNLIPANYVLQPISALLPDFKANDVERKKTAKNSWSEQSSSMRNSLARAARKILSSNRAERYQISVTEAEIDQALGSSEVSDRCVWFDRRIQDIDGQEASYLLSRYTECLGPEERDRESRERLTTLRNRTLGQLLPRENIQEYEITWTPAGVDPSKVEQHRNYIERLCVDFRSKLSAMILSAIRAKQDADLHSPVVEEVLQHTLFCQEKCKAFQGREQTLQLIESYLQDGDNKQPLTVYGKSGSGKTSILATAATKAWDTFRSRAAIVIRFIGTTPDSSNVGSLLVSMIKQLGKIYNFDTTNLPPTLKELREFFKSSLRKASKDAPLVLFLDSLDQLDTSGDARQLSWLPRELPPNVKLILSTLPEEKYEILPRLQALFPAFKNFIEVPVLKQEEASSILDTWLDQAGRTLTSEQRLGVDEAFNKCPLPLFLKLSFDQTLRWRSYSPPEVTQLHTTVRGCIDALFNRLEDLHGRVLVQRALGYLTLSKSGLSESELEDILSCDDDVLNDVYMYWTPPVRRLPPLLLVRLKTDLGQYLVDRGADGVRVFYWYHRQFIEAATDKYCSSPKQEQALHSALAQFFSGAWANGTSKPFTDPNGHSGSADRHVTSQPIKFGENYNRRKLNNLPYHRLRAGQEELLMSECLCNLEFITGKLKSEGLRPLMEDYQETKTVYPDNSALQTLSEVIHLSQSVLVINPEELPAQVISRVRDKEGLEHLLSECHASPSPFLLPSQRVVTQTGGPLLHSLAEHTQEITAVDLTGDGSIAVTTALDETVKTWDVREGKLLRSIEDVGQDGTRVHFACADTLITLVTKDNIRAFDVNSGVEVYTLSQNMTNSAFCLAGDDKSTMLTFLGKNVQLFKASDGTFIGTASNGYLEGEEAMGRDSPLAGSGNLVAIGDCISKNRVFLFDVIDSQFLKTVIALPMSEANMKDVACCVTFSSDCSHVIIGAGQSRDILFFDTKSGELVRTLPGQRHDRMSVFLHASRDGKYLVSSNWNHVVIWDLEQNIRHIGLQHIHRSIINAITVDMRIFITACSDLMLRIWDRSRDDETQGLGAPLAAKKSAGVSENNPGDFAIKSLYLIDSPRIVLLHGSFQTKGVAKEYLQVYDVTEGRVLRQIKLSKSDQLIVPWGNDKILVGSWNRTVRVLDLVTLTFGNTFQGLLPKMATAPNDIQIIGNTKVVTPTRARRNVKVYSLETGRVMGVMRGGQTERISGLQPSRSQKILLASTTKGPLLIFNMEDLTVVCSVTDVGVKNVLDLRVTSDDNFLLYKPENGDATSLVAWNIQKQKVHHRLQTAGNSSVWRFELISQDKAVILGKEGNITVSDVSSGKLEQTVSCKYGVSRICYHEDSPYFATYSNQIDDNTVKLWSTSPVECVASFTPDIRPREVFLSRDGRTPIGFFHSTPHPVSFRLIGHTDNKGNTSDENPYSTKAYFEADLSEVTQDPVDDPDDPDSDEDVVT